VNFNIVCDAKPKKGYTKSNFYNALAKDTGKYRNCIIRINALSGKIAEALVCIIGALLLFLLLLLVKSTLWLALEYLPCIISSVGFLLSSSFFTFIQFKAGSDHSDCSFFKNPEKFINTYDSEQLHLQEVQSP
jgi:hypothetical protein